MKGICIAEECHVVNILPPKDIDDTANASDVWSMAKHAHASVIVQLGVTGAATTLTVEACDDFTPSNTTAIAFAIYKEETAAGDTLGARTAIASTGVALSTNDGVFYVLEIDAAELPAGKPNLRIKFTDPGVATFGSAVAILSGERYSGDQNATAIA
jgi:hypothetical protein